MYLAKPMEDLGIDSILVTKQKLNFQFVDKQTNKLGIYFRWFKRGAFKKKKTFLLYVESGFCQQHCCAWIVVVLKGQ